MRNLGYDRPGDQKSPELDSFHTVPQLTFLIRKSQSRFYLRLRYLQYKKILRTQPCKGFV
jgi:hypothetical protein